MPFDRSARTTFDEVARDYDQARPGYPEELIEDAIALSGIPDGGRILEIGPGPGKATLPFARRGYGMLCLELGVELAAVAAENCRPYPRVAIENIAFEDWKVQEKSFDLVISAQAFHWIPPEIGYAKAAAALKDSGALALFWNHYPDRDTPFSRALDDVYRQKAPELVKTAGRESFDDMVQRTVMDIKHSGYFGEVVLKRYPWSKWYTAERYLQLLNTYSDHRRLPEDTRLALFVGIGELIEQSGGAIERPYLSVLYNAQVRQ